MKDLFIKYKSVIKFVILFLGTYLVLSALYAYYLKISVNSGYPPDFFTNLVARQSSALLDALGYQPRMEYVPQHKGMFIILEKNYAINIVEGCNAVSVIILFVAFVISFAEKFKKTFFFLLAGAVLIYVVNIFRIAMLAIALYKYPEYQDVLHSVIFPAVIYGMVFLLWIIWVRTLNAKPSK
ncbi:exosortase family protein XrtF [Aequorivita sp. H23M31]|uniref:Exosortase family protein XrtF n=1 Tax=Aequorivita ciconiae TaxID=2494375 RepID=A0A410G326_9FLAO|nr:exosortase family protein XrtF [Aequorivita sp. H23M31]QAA81641.1 exosortase family protein XrtF [Aequorivita sp. H23M31]